MNFAVDCPTKSMLYKYEQVSSFLTIILHENFQTILHQYLHTLNNCKPDALLKVGATYSEMAAQEKIIDGFIELIKRGQLDENIPTEALEKCVSYFNTMYPVLLGQEMKLNHSYLLSDSVKTLQQACDGINNCALVIRNLIEVSLNIINYVKF